DLRVGDHRFEGGNVPGADRIEADRVVCERPGRRPQAPWHFLYFLPEPHQQGSLRPTFSCSPTGRCCGRWRVFTAPASPPSAPAITAAPASDSCSYERPPFPTADASCTERSSSASSACSWAW